MGWTEFEDPYDGRQKKKLNPKVKARKNSERDLEGEEENSHKKKRSSIRSHRKKTHKDQFWEDNG